MHFDIIQVHLLELYLTTLVSVYGFLFSSLGAFFFCIIGYLIHTVEAVITHTPSVDLAGYGL
jgi:hypothetical protein